jgi:hypothetical protein
VLDAEAEGGEVLEADVEAEEPTGRMWPFEEGDGEFPLSGAEVVGEDWALEDCVWGVGVEIL